MFNSPLWKPNDIETFSALMAFYDDMQPITGKFPSQKTSNALFYGFLVVWDVMTPV